jgi:hypothetical protein
MGPGEAYGDYAAKIWLSALKPSLVHRTWTWPDPEYVPGVDVPDITGMSFGAAKKLLRQSHLRLQRFDAADALLCPSDAPLNTIGYYGPHRAKAGSTITACLSLGVSQPIYVPPPPPPPPPPPAPPPDNGGGGNNGGGHGNGGGGHGGGGGGSGGGGNGGGGGGSGGGGTGGGGSGGGGTGGGGSGGGGTGGGGGSPGGGGTGGGGGHHHPAH